MLFYFFMLHYRTIFTFLLDLLREHFYLILKFLLDLIKRHRCHFLSSVHFYCSRYWQKTLCTSGSTIGGHETKLDYVAFR